MSTTRKTRWLPALLAGVAIAGAAAMPLAAQDTSAKRIKIQKVEPGKQTAGGDVCLPMKCMSNQSAIDSALAAERATIADREQYAREAQKKLDSIAAEARLRGVIARMQNTVAAARESARLDSIARFETAEREAQLAMKRHLARGFYLGLAGGANMAQRGTRNGYTGGWNATVPLGWDASDSRFGFRTDFSVDHMNGTLVNDQMNITHAASGDITVWSLNADLKVRAHAPGASSRTNLYALGGVGAHRVVNGVYGVFGPNAGENLSFNNAKTNFGWNVGAGLSVAWGPTEMFVESRFFQVKSNLDYHMNGGVGTYTSFTPIVLGLTWF
jgi:opacity protein-like surface antigen